MYIGLYTYNYYQNQNPFIELETTERENDEEIVEDISLHYIHKSYLQSMAKGKP